MMIWFALFTCMNGLVFLSLLALTSAHAGQDLPGSKSGDIHKLQ